MSVIIELLGDGEPEGNHRIQGEVKGETMEGRGYNNRRRCLSSCGETAKVFHTGRETGDSLSQSEPELVQLVRKCIFLKNSIELCTEGVGGTYFIRNEKKIVAVFKPNDEEPGAPNNPKKTQTKPLLPPGGGTHREIAAYLLDRHSAGVPETYMLEKIQDSAFSNPGGIATPKYGSLQKFVKNIGDASSMGSSRFLVQDVHNIGILDLRLFNMDRNSENLLVQEKGDNFRLVPIDHTYILPGKLDNAWFEWLHWTQAKLPFSRETLDYIDSINVDEDAELLRSLEIEEESIRIMKISTRFLKKAASAGWTLFEIANSVCRRILSEESDLEKFVSQAQKKGGDLFEKEFDVLIEKCVVEIPRKITSWP